MKKLPVYFLTLICLFSLCTAMTETVNAVSISEDTVTRASDYFSFYSARASTGKKCEVIISFDVVTIGYMDLVGSTYIAVQEKNGSSWTDVASYFGSISNGRLVANRSAHAGSVTFTGTSGKQYRARVTIYAADSRGSDSRVVTTNTVVAP